MAKKLIILMGVPGSGKGTQGSVMSNELGIPHISTGEIFREIGKIDFANSKLILSCMQEGKLIPSNIVNEVVTQYISSDQCEKGCIIDGYPRTLEQAEYLSKSIEADITAIFFDLDDTIAVKRILGRMACFSCGRVYNKYFDKPLKDNQCNDCGSHDFCYREDDDENTVKARLEEYKKETLSVIEYYRTKGRFFSINAAQNKEKVINNVLDVIKMI